jgi:hypothetical protein
VRLIVTNLKAGHEIICKKPIAMHEELSAWIFNLAHIFFNHIFEVL